MGRGADAPLSGNGQELALFEAIRRFEKLDRVHPQWHSGQGTVLEPVLQLDRRLVDRALRSDGVPRRH